MLRSVATAIIGRPPLFREGLIRILDESTFRVVGQADEVGLIGGRLARLQIDLCVCVVADGEDPRPIVASVRRRFPTARLAILCGAGCTDAAAIFAAGADACLPSAMAPRSLLMALELLLPGNLAISFAGSGPWPLARGAEPMAVSMAGTALPPEGSVQRQRTEVPGVQLSGREVEILEGIAEGESNKHISRRLSIAEATVKVHVRAVLRKIGAHNRTQAAIWATIGPPSSSKAAQSKVHLDS